MLYGAVAEGGVGARVKAERYHARADLIEGLAEIETVGWWCPDGYPNCTERLVKDPSIHRPVRGKVVLALSSAAAPAVTNTGA
ncbi:MAG: hypothetical protein IT384_29065 [Deltaproteobacteria bacterium]|nr:hypothetical protein [Deltaproteobacteria bacterium]